MRDVVLSGLSMQIWVSAVHAEARRDKLLANRVSH